MIRNLTHNTILPMPLLTKTMYRGSTYVVCKASLRAAVLNRDEVITLGSQLDLQESLVYAARVLDSIKMR